MCGSVDICMSVTQLSDTICMKSQFVFENCIIVQAHSSPQLCHYNIYPGIENYLFPFLFVFPYSGSLFLLCLLYTRQSQQWYQVKHYSITILVLESDLNNFIHINKTKDRNCTLCIKSHHHTVCWISCFQMHLCLQYYILLLANTLYAHSIFVYC